MHRVSSSLLIVLSLLWSASCASTQGSGYYNRMAQTDPKGAAAAATTEALLVAAVTAGGAKTPLPPNGVCSVRAPANETTMPCGGVTLVVTDDQSAATYRVRVEDGAFRIPASLQARFVFRSRAIFMPSSPYR